MKARSKELLDKAIAATVAAIEVYNKPDFLYREESFAVLAVNGWELLLKAKWLSSNGNRLRSLCVLEPITLKDGSRGKRQTPKLTRSGSPFTHSIDYLARKLVEGGHMEEVVWRNLQVMIEMRDTSVHFYNHGTSFSIRLQEVGAASLRNFVGLVDEWFGRDLSDFNFYLMPLAFVRPPASSQAVILNKEECNLLRFIEALEADADGASDRYSVSVNVELRYTRSKAKDALEFRWTNNPSAPELRLTEEQIRDRYPLGYNSLTAICLERFADFKQDQKYHGLRKTLRDDRRFGIERRLYPGNPKSPRTWLHSNAILEELAKHYQEKHR
jgi:hypothetical protein